MLIKSVSSIKVSIISVLHFSNVAQFLNISCVAALSGCFLWIGLSPAVVAIDLVTLIFPVTKIYASE